MIWKDDLILIDDAIEYLDAQQPTIGSNQIVTDFLDTDVKKLAFLSQLHFAIEGDNRFRYDFIAYHEGGRGGDGTVFNRQRGFVILDTLGTLIGANITGGHKNAILDVFAIVNKDTNRTLMFDKLLNTKFGSTEDGARFYDEEWSAV